MLLDMTHMPRTNKISLTPLIDVVFILLLFFMLSSSFSRWFSIDISAPKKVQAETVNINRIRLLNNSGSVTYAGLHLGSDYSRLMEALENDTEKVFLIDSERRVNTQTLVKLIDYLNQEGITRVSLGATFDLNNWNKIEEKRL